MIYLAPQVSFRVGAELKRPNTEPVRKAILAKIETARSKLANALTVNVTFPEGKPGLGTMYETKKTAANTVLSTHSSEKLQGQNPAQLKQSLEILEATLQEFEGFLQREATLVDKKKRK